MTIPAQITALQDLSVPELAAQYQDLFGRPPRSRHPAWLRKRIAFRLQETAYGGLSGAARAEVERLAADLRLPDAAPSGRTAGDEAPAPKVAPQPGTVLQRDWHGQRIRVEVVSDGFVWNGDRYTSLSAVARAITGARWNGRLFFGLTGRAGA